MVKWLKRCPSPRLSQRKRWPVRMRFSALAACRPSLGMGIGTQSIAPVDIHVGPGNAFFADRPAFHILVNNAGTNRPKPMWDVTQEHYSAVFDLNVTSAVFVAQACVQKMLAFKARVLAKIKLGRIGSVEI